MTRKDFWLKLFAENDTALSSALILLDRFATEEQLTDGREYIESRIKELYEEMPLDVIQATFPDYKPAEKGGADE